jgi:uncharacterized spore protein YtfJ
MTQTVSKDQSVMDSVRGVVQGASSRQVFGEPIVQDGVTLIPAAKVGGGGGGGMGTGGKADEHEGSGSGGGVGMSAKPVGMFVVKNGQVGWRPAVDINKIVMGGQIVMAVALLTVRAIVKAKGRK